MSGQKPHLPWSKHCVCSHKRRWSSLTLGMNIDYNIPRIQGIPLLRGITWWPSPIASEVMVLSYQIILWLAKRCMSAVQWQDDPAFNGRVGGVQLTVCLLVLQKWPLKIHGFIVHPIPQLLWCRQECRVQRGMMKEMQLDASAPWHQRTNCESHGMVWNCGVLQDLSGKWEQHWNNDNTWD